MLSARQVLEKHWDGRLPVNVVALARALGFQVQPSTNAAVLDSWWAGLVRTIEFNPDLGEMRERFALAHALGHYALNHLKSGTRRLETAANFGSGATAEEREANAFALALLVPENTLLYAINHRGITDAAKLAETFGVSQVAMKQRLQHTGIL